MADEREDGVERLRHEGRVHRWQRRGSAWPGHTAFVAIRAGEVIVGDRYAGEGIERTYACQLEAFIDGCFQALIGEQLGAGVLAEVVAEVRRELGPPPASPAAAITKTAHERGAASASVAGSEQSPVAAPTKGAVRAPEVPKAGAERASEVALRAGSQAPAAAPRTKPQASERLQASDPAGPQKAVSGHSAAGHVDVAVVACRAVDLPLAVALRTITRTSVQELLGRLARLPCTVRTGVSQTEGEAIAQRLAELGAEVRLAPARAS